MTPTSLCVDNVFTEAYQLVCVDSFPPSQSFVYIDCERPLSTYNRLPKMVPIENFVVLLQFNSVASPEWVPVNSSIMKVVNGTLHFCQRLVELATFMAFKCTTGIHALKILTMALYAYCFSGPCVQTDFLNANYILAGYSNSIFI